MGGGGESTACKWASRPKILPRGEWQAGGHGLAAATDEWEFGSAIKWRATRSKNEFEFWPAAKWLATGIQAPYTPPPCTNLPKSVDPQPSKQ